MLAIGAIESLRGRCERTHPARSASPSVGALMSSKSILAVAILAVLAAGCARKQAEESSTSTQPPQAAPAPAAVASRAPSAASAETQDPAVIDERAAAIQAALAEDAIVSDPRGQWAVSATASSTYSGDKNPASKTGYAPMAATGAPNVERYGDNGHAWTTETPDKGIEWLEVQFAKPVHATQIRIRQNYAPGAIIKVELIDENGAKHTVAQGVDQQKYPPNTISWFDRSFEKTAYKAVGARITLATNAVPGWNEIDAVQLLGD